MPQTSRPPPKGDITSEDDSPAIEQISARFLVSMSRKLRGDLGALSNYLEVLRQHTKAPEQLDLIDSARAAAQHLSITLNSATDYARATGGHLKPKRAKFNLRQLIHEVVSVVAVDARQRDIAIIQQLEPDLPQRLRGDRVMVGECLAHVMHNAVMFGRTTVRFSVQYTDGELIALIEDDGPGVPRTLTERAFLPFETLQDDSRYHDGPGLGLAVTRAFTELLKGEVHISAGESSGTVVELRWPIQKTSDWTAADPETLGDEHDLQLENSVPDLELMPLSEAPFTDKPTSDTRSFHNVLVVDDDPNLREVVMTVLNSMGVPYDCARDGEEGLQKLRANDYTAAIIDMQMPVMNGFSVIREIRRDPLLCSLKILALTSLKLRQEKDACFDAGCDLYQAKPVTFTDLSRRISELLSLTKANYRRTEDPARAEAVADNLTVLQERYAASFPALMQQLTGLAEETLEGSSEAMDDLRSTLHRIAGTSGSLYFDELSKTSAAACTTVRALQRAYPDPALLPADSRRALKSATRRVNEQLESATIRPSGTRSA